MKKTTNSALLTETINKTDTNSATTSRFPAIYLTRAGVMYIAVNLILVLTAINYSNHNILVIAFFLMSLLAVSLVMAVRVFRSMELCLGEVRPVFVGQDIIIPVSINTKTTGDAIPLQIKLILENREPVIGTTKLPSGESDWEHIRLTPNKRGRYNIINMQVSSSFPFGLFRIRRSFAVSHTYWVYVTPLDQTARNGVKKNRRSSERGDSVFLRQYRLGDPVRRIHKKSLAMGQHILVKDIEARKTDSQWLQWDTLPKLAGEKRLQILTRQVLDAEQQGRPYGLSLPNMKINPAVGETHKHQCLRVLAEFE